MTIEEFRDSYLRLCRDFSVEPQDCIINALTSAQKSKKHGGSCLNLSTHSLTTKTCMILGKVFSTDRTFTEVRFNDCMLSEEGTRAITAGLSQNVVCKRLDIKGNNIKGSSAESVGKMLKNNNRLLSVCLEWNALGMLDTAFGAFCEGLACNTHLQILDLRNNQISHDGAAALAIALKRNSTLRMLDLRWNNIGLVGGRHLVEALQVNRTLCRLELTGNNTPEDVLKAITTSVQHNADRASLTEDYETRQKILSKEVQDTKKARSIEMSGLLDKLDQKDAEIRRSQKSASNKLSQLQDALDERKAQINTLASKLALAESETAISESKINELCGMLSQTKEDMASMARNHQQELKREREDRALKEAKLNKQLIELEDVRMSQENKIVEFEHKSRGLQEENYMLKDKLTNSQAEHKMKISQYEDKLQLEGHKAAELLKEAEEKMKKETERVKQSMDENVQLWRDKANRLESTKLQLEEEISRLKNTLNEERLHSEQEQHRLRTLLKEEADERYKQYEDKVQMANKSREEINHHSIQLNHTITDLQSKNSSLTLEMEALKRKNDQLSMELAGKNSETLTEVNKVKMELQQKIQRLEAERQTKEELYDKIQQLHKDITEQQTNSKTLLAEKDSQIYSLQERIKTYEAEMRRAREEENQRAAVLQAAIQSYISRPPPPTAGIMQN